MQRRPEPLGTHNGALLADLDDLTLCSRSGHRNGSPLRDAALLPQSCVGCSCLESNGTSDAYRSLFHRCRFLITRLPVCCPHSGKSLAPLPSGRPFAILNTISAGCYITTTQSHGGAPEGALEPSLQIVGWLRPLPTACSARRYRVMSDSLAKELFKYFGGDAG